MTKRHFDRALILIFILYTLTGCAGSALTDQITVKDFRRPASLGELDALEPITPEMESDFDSKFKFLMSTASVDHFNLRIQLQLDAIEELYLRANQLRSDFDEALFKQRNEAQKADSNFLSHIIESNIYPKLLVLRHSLSLRQHRMLYFIEKFQEIASNLDSSVSQESQNRGKEALRYIGDYYRHLPKHYLIAHRDIGLELTHDQKVHSYLKRGVERMLALRDEMSQDEENQISKAAKEVEKTITPLSRSLDQEAAELKDSLLPALSNTPSRTPQSVKIEPSIGEQGNVMGSKFEMGTWSLTFDDGPHSTYTHQILSNLHDLGFKATFFMLASEAIKYPKISQDVLNAGMEAESHSYTHPQLSLLKGKKLEMEISTATDKIAEVLGTRPKLFRCPYGDGAFNPKVRSIIAREKMVHIYWNVDSLDWQDHNPSRIVQRVKDQIKLARGGGVILFHDIHPQSVKASEQIMKYFKAANNQVPGAFQVLPVGEIIDQINGGSRLR